MEAMDANSTSLFACTSGASVHLPNIGVVVVVHVATLDRLYPSISKGLLCRDSFRRIQMHHSIEQSLRCRFEWTEWTELWIVALTGHFTVRIPHHPFVEAIDVFLILRALGNVRLVPQRPSEHQDKVNHCT